MMEPVQRGSDTDAAALLESSVAGVPVRRGKVRDWLETNDWDKDSEPPALPNDVATRTRAKYIEAFELLVGAAFPWA